MRKGDKKILFTNPDKVTLLVNLRLNGWSLPSLATYLNCDKSSLRHWLNKYQIEPLEAVFSPVDIAVITVNNNIEVINGVRVNMGHSYKQYLRTAKERERLKSLYTIRAYPPANQE